MKKTRFAVGVAVILSAIAYFAFAGFNEGKAYYRTIEEVDAMGADAGGKRLRVAGIVIDELKLEDVTPETFERELDLVDELGIDSMDLTAVVLVLQDEYNIEIDEDDYPGLKNIRLIAEYIQGRIA